MLRKPCLYRCTVVLGLAACVAPATQTTLGQESIPVPPQTIDTEANDPFANDPPVIIESATPTQPEFWVPDETVPVTAGTFGTLDRLHGPLLRRDLKINGAQSCATANCHGGPRPGVAQPWARRAAAFHLWRENDPHAESWRTICGDESVEIMRRLKIMDGDQIVDQKGFDNCLACHNSTMRYNEPRTTVDNREGVGCAACHGPSERWIDTHFQYHWSPKSAQHEGFVDAGDLYTRARMCASCHVGDKDRDMNHDIIAAGHPALRYEMATFHAWQPKHWRDAEAADKTFYEAQLWLAGQVAATDASLSLLEARSGDLHTVSEWPEFAAYNCASCHHNLGLDNDRNAFDTQRLATAKYSQWNDAGIRWLIDYRQENGQATDEDFQLIAALDDVERAMVSSTTPDAEAVAAATLHARKMLSAWFDGAAGMHERSNFRSDRLGQVVVSAAGKPRTFQTWESAVQFYLAAVAARESWPGGWNGQMKNVANQMQFGLRYPEMIDISRFAKRDEASGPTLSRRQATLLGVELAGWLGPVQPHPEVVDEFNPATIGQELDQLLNEIAERWKGNPPATNVQPEVTPPENRVQPENPVRPEIPETQPRESIEDIRKALEALQSGDGASSPDTDSNN